MTKSLIVSGLIAFFSTTLDDFAVMLIFFSRAQQMQQVRLAYMQVIVGQTIGFSIVIILSLAGLVLGLIIPEKYVDLIGFMPLLVGLHKLYEILSEEGWLNSCTSHADRKVYDQLPTADDEHHTLTGKVGKTSGGFAVAKSSGSKVADDAVASDVEIAGEENDAEEEESNMLSEFFKHALASTLDQFMLEVVVYALVCSSDNIGIYVSIFASMKPWEVFVTIVLFYILLGFNILGAILLMQCKQVATFFGEYSKYIVPPLLIGLGLYILADSVIWPF